MSSFYMFWQILTSSATSPLKAEPFGVLTLPNMPDTKKGKTYRAAVSSYRRS